MSRIDPLASLSDDPGRLPVLRQLRIDAKTRALTASLHDLSGRSLFSVELADDTRARRHVFVTKTPKTTKFTKDRHRLLPFGAFVFFGGLLCCGGS